MSKPMPRIMPFARPFWEGCNEDRLVIQRCSAADCGKFVYFPRVACPHCHRDTLEWQEVSGHGTVVSHTTVHRPHHEIFAPLVPYVFAAVRIDEGPVICGRLRNADASANLMGRRISAAYEPFAEGQKVLLFEVDGA